MKFLFTNGVYRMLDSRIGKVEGWDVLENNVIHHIEKYQNKIYFLLKKWGLCRRKWIFVSLEKSFKWNFKTANINLFLKKQEISCGNKQ
jgi:hypothetical protein